MVGGGDGRRAVSSAWLRGLLFRDNITRMPLDPFLLLDLAGNQILFMMELLGDVLMFRLVPWEIWVFQSSKSKLLFL